MSSTQGNLVLVLMGATAAAPWAALALESRVVRTKRARGKARRALRAAGIRAVPGKIPIANSEGRDATITPIFADDMWFAREIDATPGFPHTQDIAATVTPIVAPADDVFVSVGAVVALPSEPPELAA